MLDRGAGGLLLLMHADSAASKQSEVNTSFIQNSPWIAEVLDSGRELLMELPCC